MNRIHLDSAMQNRRNSSATATTKGILNLICTNAIFSVTEVKQS